MKNPYVKTVLENIPKVLSNLDRDKDSLTFGCFDRQHWNYKIRDFSSVILQQNCLSLALLYKNDIEGNIYFGNKNVKEWAIAAMKYWQRVQLKDGSFNEYWPNEHSIPATVFSLFAVAESYKILKMKDKELTSAMLRSARWLVKHPEEKAINQEIASMAAIYSVYTIVKEDWLLKAAEKKRDYVLSRFNADGFFPEYNGADMGYLTVSLNYLCEYYRLSQDKKAEDAIVKTAEFLAYFVHPDGTFGGEYGSRNTEYFLPNGFEIANKLTDTAGICADKLMAGLNYSVDERYTLHYVMPSFVSAIFNHQRQKVKAKKMPYEYEFKKYFKDAGIFVYSDARNYAILSLKKGGVLKVFTDGKLRVNDCGYKIKLTEKKFGVTNWNGDLNIEELKDGFSIEGSFYLASYLVPTPIKHMALRILALFFGSRIIPLLKRKFILAEKKMKQKFRREFFFEKDRIFVRDRIISERKIKQLIKCDAFSMRYVPSSKFFMANELFKEDGYRVYNNVKDYEVERAIMLR